MPKLTDRQKKIAYHLLAGLDVAGIEQELGEPAENWAGDVPVVLGNWLGAGGEYDIPVALARLNHALRGIWGKVDSGDIEAVKAMLTIIERQQKLRNELGEPDPFDAAPNLPGQVESRLAYRQLESAASWGPWWKDYQQLRSERAEDGKPLWNWREAVYIAWASLPKRLRWPGSQEELAKQVLGLTNDRTIREWRSKRPEIEERVAQLTGEVLMKHRADVLDALVRVASEPDSRAYSDRRLFLEMTGDYKTKGVVNFNIDFSQLSDEQLQRIADGEDPTAVVTASSGQG